MKLQYLCLLIISATHLVVDAMRGGSYLGIKEIPYMAQLFLYKDSGYMSYCGATIISKYWVVSAAHCIGHPDTVDTKIFVGTSGTLSKGKMTNVSQIIIHGSYEGGKVWDYDICLVKGKNPIPFSQYAQPIRVAHAPPKPGDMVTLSGFGDSHYGLLSNTVQIARVPVIKDETCRRNYTVTANMFCTSTARVDLCYGDSGSPVVFNDELVGVVSQGCEYTAPNVIIKVAKFYDWILKHTGIRYSD